MPLCQRHGSIETDDGELLGDLKDFLNDHLPYFFLQVIQLSRIVPGHPGAIVSLVDIPFFPVLAIHPLEYDRSITLIEIVIFKIDTHIPMPGKVWSVETIGGEGAVIQGNEPLWMFDDPSGIDPYMVRYHIAGQANTSSPSTIFQILEGFLPAQVSCTLIIEEGVCGSHSLWIA